MNIKEAYTFYKKQFDMFTEIIDLTGYDKQLAEEIIEQVGKPFSTVLELGAGNGLLARTLANYEKNITTVELVPEMVEFAEQFKTPNVTSLCGSFYEIDIKENFDLILYMDGFGVGTDDDQLRLLKRIYHWLEEDGIALIDIYQPNYWKKTAGQEMKPLGDSKISRVYGYDDEENQIGRAHV